ncbi:MAG TPA: undecaprenyl-diphosphate phosphatase [Solirubrobacteraceae bacterium]|nr:undecaprenyl-diphosphate phosphatase [Solirubrobacteraceae bacterium]
MPERPRGGLSPCEAIALGLVQGPTELLPVSSSAHTTLLAYLIGSPYGELPGRARKEFEVALHAGAGLALAIEMRRELLVELGRLDGRGVATMALATLPPALVGYALEGPIERRLGGPVASAWGLAGGAVAMAMADGGAAARWSSKRTKRDSKRRARARARVRARAPQKERDVAGERALAGPGDGLALGVAQALALAPGVSRSGATLTAARARGFAREDAAELSWHTALPVLLGASALKGWRLWRDGRPEIGWGGLALGGVSAFVATLLSARLARRMRLSERPLLGFAIYRCGLAAVILWRAGRAGRHA